MWTLDSEKSPYTLTEYRTPKRPPDKNLAPVWRTVARIAGKCTHCGRKIGPGDDVIAHRTPDGRRTMAHFGCVA
jgi:5-methylcytosine-specific restriction endonuclease McrA